MAVKIKLKRIGKIRIPQYRIVVADGRTRRGGRAIEEVGLYRPKEDPSFIKVESDRIQHWLSVGAQPTDPVMAILKVTGDWQKFKGLPGAEGTLRMAGEKTDKQAIFDAAAKEAESEQGRLEKLQAAAAKKADEERKAERAAAKAEAAAKEADAKAQAAAKEAAAKVTDKPAEAAPEAKADEAAPKADESKPDAS